MARSKATTVEAYLDELPDDRRVVISGVRAMVLAHLPAGYQEAMRYGMISYEIPLERFPDTYNSQPLNYIGLAANKNSFALHLMCIYCDAKRTAWLKNEFKKAGKKLDMGKACIRFKKLDDLPLDVLGSVVALVPPEKMIERYRASRKK